MTPPAPSRLSMIARYWVLVIGGTVIVLLVPILPILGIIDAVTNTLTWPRLGLLTVDYGFCCLLVDYYMKGRFHYTTVYNETTRKSLPTYRLTAYTFGRALMLPFAFVGPWLRMERLPYPPKPWARREKAP